MTKKVRREQAASSLELRSSAVVTQRDILARYAAKSLPIEWSQV